ncbi:alpha-1,3-mannosyl-glycoprotein 4-beta-N-acetylglucosaminyltransferase A isoform X2 [Monodelphis domestica]|uniref:Alpha-1,3-mannosyl-glycoprotein 4-beta-N-acetylglucosaminyltransferase A n=1 Tax=Monodelphis domestica TaxID=13616 RepID=A0A5F8GYI2_MONDO|nr:alpha-1,3-mannosyl-glycoprotein 4-beta-N-acetylglucosaminyltransferase A isoform X2 [Monodelphis domestica]XP_056662948.1 alpha-1,3-mannosyl-glycoprotein 4-beta-N-acetylglucosaminyltransferase A isoform X2 [Monodelphis domestica]
MRLRNGTVTTILVFITSFLSLSWFISWQNGKEKLIAYQPEFHALKQRLRIAEHRILQRSSELNAILEQFRRVIAETNGTKATSSNFSDNTLKLLKDLMNRKSLQVPNIYYHLPHLLDNEGSLQPAVQIGFGRARVSIVMGIPTVKRKVKSYLVETLHSLIDKLSPEEMLDCIIVVYIGETDLDYVHSVVAILEKEWRTKQNLDYCFLMMYAQEKGIYYIQLEDDIVVKQNYFSTIKNFALQVSSEDWMILEFSQLGFIGKMFQASDITLIVEFIFMFYKEKPIDWLLDHILWVKVCNPEKDAKHCDRQKSNLRIRFRPSLFQHVGLHSSLEGKIQKLTDKDFLKPLLHTMHVNPPAEVSTSLKVYQGHTLEKTYMGEDFFWAVTPIAGDYILFKFDKPVDVESYLFQSGNPEHPGDILINTTVEVLPFKGEELEISKETKDNQLEDGYIRIGKFEGGVAEGMVDPILNPISAFRLSVIQNSAVWAVLNEIHIKKVPN